MILCIVKGVIFLTLIGNVQNPPFPILPPCIPNHALEAAGVSHPHHGNVEERGHVRLRPRPGTSHPPKTCCAPGPPASRTGRCYSSGWICGFAGRPRLGKRRGKVSADPDPQLPESPDLRAAQSLTTGIAGKSVTSAGDIGQSLGVGAGGQTPPRRAAPFLRMPSVSGHGARPPVLCVCESCPREWTAPTAGPL